MYRLVLVLAPSTYKNQSLIFVSDCVALWPDVRLVTATPEEATLSRANKQTPNTAQSAVSRSPAETALCIYNANIQQLLTSVWLDMHWTLTAEPQP